MGRYESSIGIMIALCTRASSAVSKAAEISVLFQMLGAQMYYYLNAPEYEYRGQQIQHPITTQIQQ